MTLTVPALVPRKSRLSLPIRSGGDAPPKKRGGKYEPGAGTVVRGTKLKLYPKQDQTTQLDLFRRRTRTLWNLLLGMEQAAYSGEPYLSEVFDWRAVWVDVARLNHQLAIDRREKRIAEGKEAGAEPALPDIDKMLARGLQGKQPRLFIWENDLQKIMARLKQVPHTKWIGDLPSHAAQHVVKDLIKALQAMLRERKKRLSGAGGRDTGFPRFKSDRYASGSIYFANTQLQFDLDRSRVKFPNGIGWVRFDGSNIQKGDKFMGARAWRQGETWWLSPQFEVPTPAAPPLTGRQVGVKVAAGTLATVYDGRSFDEHLTPREDKRAARRLKLWSRKLIWRRDAASERQQRAVTRFAKYRDRKVRFRKRRSEGFYEASARIATIQAHEANQRNDLLHKVSRSIVNSADHITIEQLDVAGMMARSAKTKRQRRQERRRQAMASVAPTIEHKAPGPVLRKAMRRAATARFLGYIKYKADDAARTVTETHPQYPRVQECRACGVLNELMKDGRAAMRCKNEDCGAILRRNRNAADNIRHMGDLSRQSGLEPQA